MISEPALDRLAGMFRAPDLTGTRYQMRSILGRGGMGIVYLAHDRVLDRDVALKVVDRDGPTAAAADAFALEARILASLEHPGIVPVHDFGELPDGRLFYAMKRVRGARLDRWLAGGRDLAARLAVFARICDAVAFAHSHAIVHRDLKPENVVIGEFGEVLVLDWGIAQTTRSQSDSHTVQSDHQSAQRIVAGTPTYMSPEQVRGDSSIDHRTDIYALGVVLASMGGPAALKAIATKAQADEPAARYQSVQDLAADVSRFVAGRAVEAHRERLVERLGRVWRRYKLPIVLVIAYLAARLLLIWLARV
jgi:serine/threonine protein kinase